MAKKGQTVQLQVELNTDEEWEKYILKPGLLVIDIYSDWCGPCAGMQANLKKIKVEIGGDTLQLAIAKCDTIDALERFRGTSEPTWMIIAGGQMVNFMYGANAPKLTQLITEELKIQKKVEENNFVREKSIPISERSPEEAERWEAIQNVIAEEQALEAAKKAQEIHRRLVKESDAILENLGNLGVIVVLPHARDKYAEIMKDMLNEAGLVISISEKMKINDEQIEAISYFLEEDQSLYLSRKALEHLYTGGDSQVVVVKASHGTADMEDPISVRVLNAVYGPMGHPPGEEDCPYKKLIKYPSLIMDTAASAEQIIRSTSKIFAPTSETEASKKMASKSSKLKMDSQTDKTSKSKVDSKEMSASKQISSTTEVITEIEEKESQKSEEEEDFLIGIWAPPTRRVLSSCFKILFPRMAGPLLIPEPPPKPPYISVCFPVDRRQKIQSMMEEWSSEVEKYGIFSSCKPEEAELVAKSFKKYDKPETVKTGHEKIVIQLARKKSECLLAFAIELPLYMSPNIHQGKRECKLFFPEGYDAREKDEDETIDTSDVTESERLSDDEQTESMKDTDELDQNELAAQEDEYTEDDTEDLQE